MLADRMRALFEYNYWANQRILDMSASLSIEQFLAFSPFPHGGIRDTLAHLLFAEWIWRQRCTGHSLLVGEKMPQKQDFSEVAALRAFWVEEERAMREYLLGRTDSDLAGSVHYTTTRGVPFEEDLADILLHVVIHGMQHRSELAQMLTELGHSPGDIDYILYRRQASV